MRLRRKNSLQASKLPGSLRRSALRSHESKVGTSPAASDSPETLTKRGKISRVSERSIHKIATPRVHDEKEEGEDIVVSRRMTRAMDGEEPGKLDAPKRFKDPGGEKHHNRGIHGNFKNNVSKKAGMKSRALPASTPAEHRDIENSSYRKKLRHQEQNTTENGDDRHQAMATDDPRVLDNYNRKLTRSDVTKSNYGNDALELDEQVHVPLIQDPKKLSQARAVLRSLRQQQRVPLAGGVITRHKANSTVQAQPLRLVDGESEAHPSSKRKHLEKNICAGGVDAILASGNTHSEKLQTSSELPAEAKKKKGLQDHTDQPSRKGPTVSTSTLNDRRVLTRTGKAQQEGLFQRKRGRRITRKGGAHKTSDEQSAYSAVDCARSSPKRKLKKHGKGGGNGSNFLQHWKKRRTINRLGDSDHANTKEATIHPGTSPHKASEEGLNQTARNLKVTPTLRRSKRRRNTDCLSDHEATPRTHDTKPSESMLQVRGQTGDVAVRDGFCPKGISSSIEHLQGNDTAMEKGRSTPKAAENEIGPNLDVFKIDPLSKCCLVATNPTETGGRQMRPRPLDLEQPLLVLVEGASQDYYDFDGGSFYCMLQQQPEFKNTSISKLKLNGSNRKSANVLDATGEKAEPILIPSFRSRMESEDGVQNSGLLYVLPNSYIKTSSGSKNLQAEYDMDSEDEEWLNNYNQSVSPASTLSADQFEKIIDLLEKKAADVNGYSSITEAFEEDQEREPASEECCICNGGENSNDNTVYQCSTCHILVHRSCYGLQKSGRNIKRKRNWNCRKCEAVAKGEETADLSCALCCKQGGALKPSTELGRWAHVVCALYTNETYFVNPDAMEPIDGLDAADARAKRQKRQCWLCGVREGAVERCSVPGCKALFHVSCGVTQGASFELQHSNRQVISVRVYCPKHALSALGAVKAKPEEPGEKEEQDEENQSLKVNQSVDHEELSPAMQEISSHDQWSRKQRKRKSLSQSRASGQGASHHDGKDQAKISADGSLLDSCREQECTGSSAKREKTSEPAKKGRAINEGGSGEKGYAERMSDDTPGMQNANPGLMEGVYLYWVSKRERQGGALLHCIQQEHAARQFNIFNSDDDVGPAAIPLSQESYRRHSDIDMKVVAARQQLQILQKLTVLVVRRERLKLDIFLLERSILKLCLAAFSTSPRCPLCKENYFSIVCSVCNRSTCLHCLLSSSSSGSRCKSWLDYLRLPKYVCLECEKEFKQTHRGSACLPSVDQKDDCLAGSRTLRALKKAFGCDKLLESSLMSSCKRPLILLPRSDVTQQDNLAMDVFWDQSEQKMALLSDLLKS